MPRTRTAASCRRPDGCCTSRSRTAAEFGGQDRTPPAPVRIDSGVREGDSITPHYDPMIAKLIVWGTDRAHALARMHAALADFHIVGVANNVDFLSRLVANPSFARAELDTGLIERERARLFPEPDDERVPDELLAFACARVLVDEEAGAGADPWSGAHGWRLNTNYMRTLTLKSERGVHDVDLEYARDGYVFHHGGTHAPLAISAVDGTRARDPVRRRHAGRRRRPLRRRTARVRATGATGCWRCSTSLRSRAAATPRPAA